MRSDVKRRHARWAGVALITGLAIAGCGSTDDKGAESDEPVKATHCGTGQGTTMELRATNDFPNPTAYVIQLYWFNGEGRQVEMGQMTTDAIQPGKSLTFNVTGRRPGDATVRTCEVKVLGAE
ncbi:hypothetical protein [Streptomyces antibioticus]|uniref:Ig-like domain-containing protein n=1 Tax=Streptomyces antibioticus TaxID=1890 RepID=A0AAE6Y7Y5_STRAT|nr:hypothetical protein [Streptomyces antibioticus]QIT44786.1 hypothetical protein HCX60_15490 [Streptomyces antibioticus]